VAFCDEVGMDYVSCSPYRLPIARLAAAQAALASKQGAARRPHAARPKRARALSRGLDAPRRSVAQA
jgi:hypothetical protein